jgi:hypothetical protein
MKFAGDLLLPEMKSRRVFELSTTPSIEMMESIGEFEARNTDATKYVSQAAYAFITSHDRL